MTNHRLSEPDRLALVAEWRRSGLPQRTFLAGVEAERGIRVSARALRSWGQRLRGRPCDQPHLADTRLLVEAALLRVREVVNDLERLLSSIESQEGALGALIAEPLPAGSIDAGPTDRSPRQPEPADAAAAPPLPHSAAAPPPELRPLPMPSPRCFFDL